MCCYLILAISEIHINVHFYGLQSIQTSIRDIDSFEITTQIAWRTDSDDDVYNVVCNQLKYYFSKY